MAQTGASILPRLNPNGETSENNRSINNISIRGLSPPPQSPSRTLAVRVVRGRRRRARRNGSFAYRKKLSVVALLDMVWVVLSLGWGYHSAAQVPPQPGRTGTVITYTGVINVVDGISYFLQFSMGQMLITVLLLRDCLPILPWLRVYLIASYVLLVKTSVVIVISVSISLEMGIYDRECWRTILSNIMAMTLRLPITFLVKDIYLTISEAAVAATPTPVIAYVRRQE